jgi:hypothetical protein
MSQKGAYFTAAYGAPVLYMSAYKSFCAAPGRVCLQEPVLHLGGGWGALLYFYFLFYWFVSKRFFIVSVASIQVRNTGTNRKTKRNKPKKSEKMFFNFTKQTEKQPKQIKFPFVFVPTENFFFRFADTLAPTLVGSGPMNPEPENGSNDQVHLRPDPKDTGINKQ